ncbi:MAG: cyanophycinase [Blastocatellia bacterium]
MANQKKGTLIIIGGREDKENGKVILREVARRVANGKLVVCTAATQHPDEMFQDYERVFRKVGIKHLSHLHVTSRDEAKDEKKWRMLEDARAVFFTGGDQLKITSQIGDTPCFEMTHQVYEKGGIIAGTSAGASVMCETMMVSGLGDASHRLSNAVSMAPGFGFIHGVVIDQHFAERGRIGRLLGTIAQNPKNIGIGIDEDTAIVVEGDKDFYVIGSGTVYVIDCRDMTGSNIADEDLNQTLAVYDVRLHLLNHEDFFDLHERRPKHMTPEEIKARMPQPKVRSSQQEEK